MIRAALFPAAFVLLNALPARADIVDAARSEAAERFDRAIHLVNAGDLSGGLAEFQRAYALVPSPVVIYNVGLVYAALRRPVAAAHALEKALSHPEALSPANVDRAREVLREQSDRIGQVNLTANVKEGVVEVDNVEAARLPLAGPLDVASGSHVVGVISRGYAPARREVLVAGKERVEVKMDLTAIEGLLAHIAVRCRVPSADVLVDGERVGSTPLETTVTVAPAAHHVEVRRAGYTSAAQDITLSDGAQGELTLVPVVDKSSLGHEGGWLAITASEKQASVSIDGDEPALLTGPIELPAGPHRIHLESGGFLPAERDVDVPVGGTKALPVVFAPTPETRTHYVSAADSRRTWSWVTIGAGVALAAGGAILAVTEQSQVTSAQTSLDAVNADWVRGSGRSCDHSQQLSDAQLAQCISRLNDASNQVSNAQTLSTVGWIIAGAGGATLVTGAVLLLTGDDPHKYDEKPADQKLARWRVVPRVGPGVAFVAVDGWF